MQILGLYIHIPFCSRICIYCDFFVSTARKKVPEVIDAIKKEAQIVGENYQDRKIGTLYFGGGTPSILSNEVIGNLTSEVKRNFTTAEVSEFTVEANPVDLTNEKMDHLLHIGVNRLSVGIQSFNDRELLFLSRNHSAENAFDSIIRAKTVGFSNYSIDLIFGIPGQTIDDWRENLKRAVSLNPPHMSIYNLTIEPKTHLSKMVKLGKTVLADEGLELEMFLTAIEFLESCGYCHYEISNFSKPGFESQHNSGYWNGKDYLGLGPSAHSFNQKNRWWNVANLDSYCELLSKKSLPVETSEILNDSQKIMEYFLLNFRQRKGIDTTDFASTFGINFDVFSGVIAKYREYFELDQNRIWLNSRGFFIYNKICEAFVNET